ncbi:MAG: 16S rRNA (uracil(1498)-N(3))-methyltransferase [Caldilineaceae bacterium]|nr:16S rRNA (uracil(1498)-N(3))-methyltransferase [Caldilineaceae bacterium]
MTDSAIRLHQPVDLTPLVHQLRKVLRLTTGTLITVLDNQGNEFDVRIVDLQAKSALGEVLTTRINVAEPTAQLTLYQCSLKADKFEWILQKGTELGVSCFVPVISTRSVVRPAAALLKKYDRWHAIIREAAEQCGRGRIPMLLDPLDWDAAITHAEGARYLPWEAETTSAPSLYAVLTAAISSSPASAAAQRRPCALLIGPEGGLTTTEVHKAQVAGWQTVSLGARILRAETAALAATTVIMATTENIVL